ncbi:MAG: N-acetyl sugar amidotransferase [Bacteroidales bacterium]|nr:N-acetyl sugar amidotransferase [Bacteroidales bacterium]
MDTTVPEIRFNENGICNFCLTHDEMDNKYPLNKDGHEKLQSIADKIKRQGKEKQYDCIVGVSGGRDSTYTLYQVVRLGLRPLAVHFDNGWNSKIAVRNIKNLTNQLGVDLHTEVADWEEFKDLQLAFLEASVSDAEVPTDWVIFSILFKVAAQMNVKYIMQGHSFRTEGFTPLSWTYMDGKYVSKVHELFGKKKIHSFPIMSMSQYLYYTLFKGIKQIRPLYYLQYNEKEVLDLLQKELGWSDYGGKHYESTYTSFFQAYILPRKFNIDKRKLHLSALIRSGQISREEALTKLKQNPFSGDTNEINYVIKKFGLNQTEFQRIMNKPLKSFKDYPTYYPIIKKLEKPIRFSNKLGLVPDVVINKYYNL